ncbi:MAG TPA: ribulose-phosphate 3-epimerase, partial [Candidatus Polarisedimenticolia bacterium]|nr:ribulose-phosphate 3-epimerase [Candidatus Polarisedimenticolia bacterium]
WRMIHASGGRARIEVDGGVGSENIADLLRHGVEIFVAGSAVFDGRDPRRQARDLTARIARAGRGA